MDATEEQSPPGSGTSGSKSRIGIRGRIKHFTWANFTCTQSTGGIAILLSETPRQFAGLQTIATVIFIFNVVLFLLFCAAMTGRFVLHPHTFKKSLTRPPEVFFAGSFLLSVATIIIGVRRFGEPHTGPWLIVAVRVLFWMYAAVTLVFTAVMFVVTFSTSSVDPSKMSPAVFLMVFNTMLTGTVAATIADTQPPEERLPIIVAGVAYQGLGWIVSLMLLPWFLGSLFRNGIGHANMRPALFLPVGSAGYTIISLIGCSRALPEGYAYFARHPIAVEILQVVALWASVFLWLFTFWLSAIALVANSPNIIPRKGRGWRLQPRMGFTLSWWAIVFPNVGFTIATGYIGEEFQSSGIEWVASAMAIVLFAAWLMDIGLHFKAVLTGQIMWPGKDEDVSGGTEKNDP